MASSSSPSCPEMMNGVPSPVVRGVRRRMKLSPSPTFSTELFETIFAAVRVSVTTTAGASKTVVTVIVSTFN